MKWFSFRKCNLMLAFHSRDVKTSKRLAVHNLQKHTFLNFHENEIALIRRLIANALLRPLLPASQHFPCMSSFHHTNIGHYCARVTVERFRGTRAIRCVFVGSQHISCVCAVFLSVFSTCWAFDWVLSFTSAVYQSLCVKEMFL